MMTTYLRLFGSPQLTVNGERLQTFRSSKGVALLAYLLLEPREPHPRSLLAALLWTELDDQTACRNLTQALRRLRRDLQDSRQSRYFVIDPTNIALSADAPLTCDVLQFRQLVEQTAQRQQALSAAAELVTGELLEGFEMKGAVLFEEWQVVQREKLYRQRLAVLEAVADGALTAGRYDDAVATARQAIELESWRESAHRQLIGALNRLGKRAEALAQFETLRIVLWEEMGLQPSAETRQLIERIRAAGSSPTSNLPPTITPFIGRNHELNQITAAILEDDYRLTTVMGMGGSGKSRLAIEVGRRVLTQEAALNGVYFVPLVGVAAGAFLAQAIADALNISLAGSRSVAGSLIQQLTARADLLILDNFEHLAQDDAAIQLVVRLLQETTATRLLVTSRVTLNLLAENVFELRGLPVPPMGEAESARFEAIELFLNRAQRVRKTFRLNVQTQSHVLAICRILDGLPLGIELATTLLQRYAVDDVARRISQTLDSVTVSLRDLEQRHRSLRAVFDVSWQLLAPDERQTLAQLSVFRGSFSDVAAAAIADATTEQLDRLIVQSLVQVQEGRYQLHEVIREFAAEQVRDDTLEDRHTHYYLTAIGRKAPQLDSHQLLEAVQIIRPALNNILAAWQHAITSQQWSLLDENLTGLVNFYGATGVIGEAVAMLEAGVAATAGTTHRLAVHLKSWYAHFLAILKRGEAGGIANDALVAASRLEDGYLIALNHATLTRYYNLEGSAEAFTSHATAALRIAKQDDYHAIHIFVLVELGWRAFIENRLEQAWGHYQQAVAIGEQFDSAYVRYTGVYGDMGNVLSEQKRYDQAIAYHQRNLASRQAIGNLREEALALHWLAVTQWELGLYEALIAAEQQAIRIAKQVGDHEIESFAYSNYADGLCALGRIEEAVEMARYGVALAMQFNSPMAIGTTKQSLADCLIAQGSRTEAATAYREARAAFEQVGLSDGVYDCDCALAVLASQAGDCAAALALIEPFLAQLDSADLSQSTRAIWNAYQVLRRCDVEQAMGVLEFGRNLLYAIAANIQNERLRDTYLRRVVPHRLFETN